MTNKFNTASLSSPLNTFWGFIMKRTNLYQAIVSITALSTIMGAQAQNAGGLEEITVVGSKASLLSAVEKQRESDSIISVVDSDALGGFADTTAAEAIRRLSGISVENDQGEGRYVTIRGLSSDLNSIAVNGASMVAPENGRSVMLDGLPTELLDSITVAKTLTPEMDADSIGGRIDFRTKKPAELERQLLKVKIQNNFSQYADEKANPKLAITYGDKLNESSGHILGLTYSSKDIVAYNNETGFGWEDGYMNDDYEMRYYELTRERFGLSYDVDMLVDSGRLYLSAFYNQYDDEELRWKDEYGKLGLIDGTGTATGMQTDRMRHDAETRVRYETRTLSAVTFGFEGNVGDWGIDPMLSYSFAEEDDSDNADVTFRMDQKDTVGQIDWSNPQQVIITPTDLSIYDPAQLGFKELEITENVSKDSELAFSINAEKEFDFGVVKMGFKRKDREKDVDDYIIVYEADSTLADFDPQTLDWRIPGQTFSPQANPDLIYGLRDQVDALDVDFSDAVSRDFVTEEKVNAVFIQNTYSWDKGVLVTGFRYEDTSTDSSAFDQDGNVVLASSDHSFFAPSINVKYFLTDQWTLRGAIWKGLSRPGFQKTAPKLNYNNDGGDISGSAGNPNLKPYEATNFDVSLEFYGDDMTFVSVGLFRKDIKNAIYPKIYKTATFMGVTFNDDVKTWENADDSTIDGLELSLQYGWENGMYFAGNITLTDGESTFSPTDDTSFTTPFRKLADEAANISIGYDKGPWDVRLAANYRSDYLDWLSDEGDDIDNVSVNNSRFVDAYMQVDLTAKYKVTDSIEIKFEAVNMGNEEEYYYWGDECQLSQYDLFGRNYSVGFTYKF
jgi:TonB-dependent receptor